MVLPLTGTKKHTSQMERLTDPDENTRRQYETNSNQIEIVYCPICRIVNQSPQGYDFIPKSFKKTPKDTVRETNMGVRN